MHIHSVLLIRDIVRFADSLTRSYRKADQDEAKKERKSGWRIATVA
jgi:hypothetical protein